MVAVESGVRGVESYGVRAENRDQLDEHGGEQPEGTVETVRRRPSTDTVALTFVLAVCGILTSMFLFVWSVKIVAVDGQSMEPTLHDGDLLVMMKDRDLNEGAVAVAVIPPEWSIEHGGDDMIKRVSSRPGDRFEVDRDGVRRNGVLLKVDYPCTPSPFNHVVGPDEVFLRGDNTNQSFDSLYALCTNRKKDAFIHESSIVNSTRRYAKV